MTFKTTPGQRVISERSLYGRLLFSFINNSPAGAGSSRKASIVNTMTDELEKIIAGETETPKEALAEGEPKEEPKASEKIDEDIKKKEEQLKNLEKAVGEANERLRSIRKEEKGAKAADPEDDIPEIDMNDPSAKAWGKKIQDSVSPVTAELEMEKQEVRTSALRDFLSDRPALARNPEKREQLMDEYERLSKGNISERTKEGVLLYLQKAYASTFHDEILRSANDEGFDKARAESEFSSIAVDRGTTSYRNQASPSKRKLNQEEIKVIEKMGWTPEEWLEAYKQYGDK